MNSIKEKLRKALSSRINEVEINTNLDYNRDNITKLQEVIVSLLQYQKTGHYKIEVLPKSVCLVINEEGRKEKNIIFIFNK